jgi:hypothetical protein
MVYFNYLRILIYIHVFKLTNMPQLNLDPKYYKLEKQDKKNIKLILKQINRNKICLPNPLDRYITSYLTQPIEIQCSHCTYNGLHVKKIYHLKKDMRICKRCRCLYCFKTIYAEYGYCKNCMFYEKITIRSLTY